jgi:hypothetical protein
LGINGVDEHALFEKWCNLRVELIDTVSGLDDDCISFIDLVIRRGFNGLSQLRNQYMLYKNFINLSDSANITFKQFINLDAQSVQSTLSAHASLNLKKEITS